MDFGGLGSGLGVAGHEGFVDGAVLLQHCRQVIERIADVGACIFEQKAVSSQSGFQLAVVGRVVDDGVEAVVYAQDLARSLLSV